MGKAKSDKIRAEAVDGVPTAKRKGGKDGQLLIRIAREDHAAFMAACKRQGTSAAREIRRFIREFTDRHDAADAHSKKKQKQEVQK
ncbi:MAG: hypothetical protein AAFR47_16275 [Pseudomonadota bacterium]